MGDLQQWQRIGTESASLQVNLAIVAQALTTLCLTSHLKITWSLEQYNRISHKMEIKIEVRHSVIGKPVGRPLSM